MKVRPQNVSILAKNIASRRLRDGSEDVESVKLETIISFVLADARRKAKGQGGIGPLGPDKDAIDQAVAVGVKNVTAGMNSSPQPDALPAPSRTNVARKCTSEIDFERSITYSDAQRDWNRKMTGGNDAQRAQMNTRGIVPMLAAMAFFTATDP